MQLLVFRMLNAHLQEVLVALYFHALTLFMFDEWPRL